MMIHTYYGCAKQELHITDIVLSFAVTMSNTPVYKLTSHALLMEAILQLS